jgi:hypothetical protein
MVIIAGWVPKPVWTIWRSGNSWIYPDSNSDPSVFSPVASRYTDCPIPAHGKKGTWSNFTILLKHLSRETEENNKNLLQ